jgi:hypothetical protein
MTEVATLLVASGKAHPLVGVVPAAEEVHALAVAHAVGVVVELSLAVAAEVRACEEEPGVVAVVACRGISWAQAQSTNHRPQMIRPVDAEGPAELPAALVVEGGFVVTAACLLGQGVRR